MLLLCTHLVTAIQNLADCSRMYLCRRKNTPDKGRRVHRYLFDDVAALIVCHFETSKRVVLILIHQSSLDMLEIISD